MERIAIKLNGDDRQIRSGMTIRELLDEVRLAPIRVAVEVNRELVRRRDFEAVTLADGDAVEIVTLVGGG